MNEFVLNIFKLFIIDKLFQNENKCFIPLKIKLLINIHLLKN